MTTAPQLYTLLLSMASGPLRAWMDRHRAVLLQVIGQELVAAGLWRPAIYFASGSNAPGEIRGFAELRHPLGVAAPECGGACERELLTLAGTGLPVFVDSGAFSEVEFGDGPPRVVRPITPEAWKRVLALYSRLAAGLGSQVYIVAPDQVGNQRETLHRLAVWKGALHQLQAQGAQIIVPIQRGEWPMATFDQQIQGLLGLDPLDYIVGIPSKKDATPIAELRAFLAERRPYRLHLLGLGPQSDRWGEVWAAITELVPGADVSCDSVLIRAHVGQGRKLTRAQQVAEAELGEEVWSPGSWKTGTGEAAPDPTETLVGLTPAEVTRIGRALQLDRAARRDLAADPVEFYSALGDEGSERFDPVKQADLDQLLDQIHRQRYHKASRAEKKRRGVVSAFTPPATLDAPTAGEHDGGMTKDDTRSTPVPTIVDAPVTTTTFIIPRSRLDKAQAKAAELGLQFRAMDVGVSEVEHTLQVTAQDTKRKAMGLPASQVPTLSEWELRVINQRARAIAGDHVRIVVEAPKPTLYAVGKAEELPGVKGPETVLSDLEAGAWAAQGARIGEPYALDFQRCDICRRRVQRKTLWLLNDGRLVGGECADQLDLGHKLQAMLEGLQGFTRFAEGLAEGEDSAFAGRGGDVEDPVLLYTLASVVVQRYGYVSRRMQEEGKTMSPTTRDEILEFLHGRKPSPEIEAQVRTAFQSGAAGTAYEEALQATQAALALDPTNTFLGKVAAGLRTGNLRLLGALAYAPVLVERYRTERAQMEAATEVVPGPWEPEVGREVAGPAEVVSDPHGYEPVRVRLSITPGESGIFLEGDLANNPRAVQLAQSWPLPFGSMRVVARASRRSSEHLDESGFRSWEVTALTRALKLAGKKTPTKPGNVVTAADVTRAMELGGLTVEGLAGLLGLPAAALEKALAGKVTAPVTKALAAHPPGLWRVIGHRSFDGHYGTTHFFDLEREGDRARIAWKSSKAEFIELPESLRTDWYKLHYLEPGDVIRLRSAAIGGIAPERAFRGKVTPAAREVNRVNWIPVRLAKSIGEDPEVVAARRFIWERQEALDALWQALVALNDYIITPAEVISSTWGTPRPGITPAPWILSRAQMLIKRVTRSPALRVALQAKRAQIPVEGFLERKLAEAQAEGDTDLAFDLTPREGMPTIDVVGDPDQLRAWARDAKELTEQLAPR